MNLADIFTNFNIGKGFWQWALGAISAALAFVVANPETTIGNVIPENWAAISLIGLATELVAYVKKLVDKARTPA